MARIKEEDLRLNIVVNGDAGRKQMLELKNSIAGAEQKLKALQTRQKQMNDTNRQGSAEYERLTAEINRQKSAIDTNKSKLSSLQRQQKVNTMTLNELRQHLKLTKIALSAAVPGTENFKRLQKEVQKTTARIKELNTASTSVSSGLSAAGGKIIGVIAVAAGMFRIVGNGIGKIAEFEQANVNLSTILGKNIREISRLTDNAQSLGRTTEYTASQVTGLQTELAKLGFGESQILNMTEPILRFSTVVGAELPEAAALAGATLRIFGLQSKDTEDTLATMAVATNRSALNFGYLQESMSIVGPVANAFGLGVKDTTALLGALANAGFDASSAATATRNIILNLANANGKLAQSLGGAVRTFPELMDALIKLRDSGTDLNTTLELTDKRSVAAFNAFLSGAESAKILRDELENVDGELERIQSERLQTLEGSVKILQSAWEGFILAMSNSKGVMKDVIDFLANGITNLTRDLFPAARLSQYADENYKALVETYKMRGADVARSAVESSKREWGAILAAESTENGTLKRGGNKDMYIKAKEEIQALDAAAAMLEEFIKSDEAEKRAADEAARRAAEATSSAAKKTAAKAAEEAAKADAKARIDSENSRYYAEQIDIMRDYEEGRITTKDDYNDKLYDAEVAHLERLIKLYADSDKEREKMELQLEAKRVKHLQDRAKEREEFEKSVAELLSSTESDKTKIAVDAENRRYKEELKAFEKRKGLAEDYNKILETIEKKHNNNLAKIALDGRSQQLALLQTQHETENQRIRNTYSENRLGIKNGSAEEKESRRKEALAVAANDVKFLAAYTELLEQMVKDAKQPGSGYTPEQVAELESKLEKAKGQANDTQAILNGENKGLFSGSGGNLFGVTSEQWDQFFTRLAEGSLKAEDLVNVLTGIGEAASEGFKIASKAIDNTSKREQAEFKQYQKDNEKKKKSFSDRLNAGLMSQQQYDAAIQQLQEEEDAKAEELAIKQAEREKQLAVTQSIIDTAIAVLKTYIQFGGWPTGVAPAAIMAGIGAVQTALIAAQPVAAAYAEGGYVTADPKKRGFVNKPTILVGEAGGEYVVSADGLANPTLAPILASIESARKAGTLRSLNFGAVYPASAAIPRASGGYTTSDAAASSVVVQSESSNREILKALATISAKLDKPVPAVVSLLGRGGLYEAEEKYSRARSRGKLG